MDANVRHLLSSATVATGLVCLLTAAPLAAEEDPHAHHHAAPAADPSGPSVDIRLPRLRMVRADGKTVDLEQELADPRPTLLNFVFTTCTAICPMMSQVFAGVQAKLGDASSKVHMVSISIDPEHDTQSRLAEYAGRFNAGPQWHFYTGSAAASVAVQRAFGTYRGDKMNHEPVTFVRAGPTQPWQRIDGLATPDVLIQQARLGAAHP